MINNIKKTIHYLLALVISLWPNLLLAQYGLQETANKAGLPGAAANKTLPEIVGLIINGLLGVIGTVLIVLMLYGGFLWMTAAGEEKRVEDAKNILKNSIIGLLIIFLAYGISKFIINALLTAAQ